MLVVDDDPNARDALRSLLEDEGYTVRTATDGIAAFAKLATFCADYVIADVHMPRMDGRALIEALRELPGRQPRVIFMSAAPPQDGDDKTPFLPKPVAFDELLALLRAPEPREGSHAHP
ncbi:MAG TPA: response regulator [Polyangia bacterium]